MFQLCKYSPYFFIAFGSTQQRIHNKVTSLPRPYNDGLIDTLFRLLFHDFLSVDDVETLGQATAVVNLSAVEGANAASLLLIPHMTHASVESDYNTR